MKFCNSVGDEKKKQQQKGQLYMVGGVNSALESPNLCDVEAHAVTCVLAL